MGIRRVLTVAALLIFAILACSSLALSLRTTTASVGKKPEVTHVQAPDSAFWEQQLLACSNGILTAAVLLTDTSGACLLAVMKSAVDVQAVSPLQQAMDRLERRSPAWFAACHGPGHKAGRYFYEQSPDITARLADIDSSTCAYSIGHGVLDGFAASSPTREAFQMAAGECSRLDDASHAVHALCADGLGHVAWAATKSFAEAPYLCSLFGNELRQESCGEGIVMQVFEPAGFLPSMDAAGAPGTLPAICEKWDTASLSVQRGCYHGAGYVYSRPAWVLDAQWTARNGLDPLDKLATAQLANLMRTAAGQCRDHPTDAGIDACLFSLSQQTPRIAYLSPAATAAACAPLDRWTARCKSWRKPPGK